MENADHARVRAILVPGVAPDQWPGLDGLSAQIAVHPGNVSILISKGVHPQALPDLDPAADRSTLERLAHALEHPPANLVAVGECGLDLRAAWKERVGVERQREMLTGHFELARRHGLPLLLHCVGAHAVLLEMLRLAKVPPSVLHSYSGSAELVRSYEALGHHVSFSGALTLPGARRPRLAAQAVAPDRLLIETDTPDQTPVDRRPARNEPAFVVDVATAVAAARGVSLEEVAEQTTTNARRLFGTKVA